jgi:hypothetical protein
MTCVTDVITGILLKQQMNKFAGIWIPGSSLLNWNTAWKGIYFTLLYNVHADVSGYKLFYQCSRSASASGSEGSLCFLGLLDLDSDQ